MSDEVNWLHLLTAEVSIHRLMIILKKKCVQMNRTTVIFFIKFNLSEASHHIAFKNHVHTLTLKRRNESVKYETAGKNEIERLRIWLDVRFCWTCEWRLNGRIDTLVYRSRLLLRLLICMFCCMHQCGSNLFVQHITAIRSVVFFFCILSLLTQLGKCYLVYSVCCTDITWILK